MTCELIQAVEGCSPLPCLQWEQFSGLSLERTMCCWDYLEGIYDWTQLMPLYKLFRFWKEDVVMCLYCSHPRQPMYINKLPCSLNLPATDLEEPAFLSGLSLPSVYGVQVKPTIIHSISSSFFKKKLKFAEYLYYLVVTRASLYSRKSWSHSLLLFLMFFLIPFTFYTLPFVWSSSLHFSSFICGNMGFNWVK